MIPSVTPLPAAPKPLTPLAPPTAIKTTAPAAPDTGRASVGEVAAGNLRAETARAVDAPEQTTLLPRLRDRETWEQSARRTLDKNTPTGPPPSFEESPLERQARIAFDPPETPKATDVPSPKDDDTDLVGTDGAPLEDLNTAAPSPRQRAEVSFAETRAIAPSSAANGADTPS